MNNRKMLNALKAVKPNKEKYIKQKITSIVTVSVLMSVCLCSCSSVLSGLISDDFSVHKPSHLVYRSDIVISKNYDTVTVNDTEYILFFREKGVKLFGTYQTKRTYYTTLRNQQENIRYGHPTVKPCQIIQNFIVNSSQEGGVILDPYIGSGTTAVAAMRENRYFIGFEINEEYYEKSLKRIEEQRLTIDH